jgi:GxxExxY protein
VAGYYAVFYRLRKRAGYSELNLAEALAIELRMRGLRVASQVTVQRRYGGRSIGADRLDLLINDLIPVEIKKVARLNGKHEAQLRTYLLDLRRPVGLLLNFGGSQPEVRRVYERANDPTSGRRHRMSRPQMAPSGLQIVPQAASPSSLWAFFVGVVVAARWAA